MHGLLFRSAAATTFVLALSIAMPRDANAGVEEGVAAFLAGNRIVAWRELLPSAKAGDAEAQYYVGTMYRQGFGTERDEDEARFWIGRAADQGHAEAEFVLGFDLLQQRQGAEAAKYILAAAHNGFAAAQYYAGLLYRDGTGVERNAYQALGWILQAAEKDHVEAQYEAGWLLAKPQDDVRQDLAQAYRWFYIAASAGYPAAAHGRDEVAKSLSPDQLADAREIAQAWIATHR